MGNNIVNHGFILMIIVINSAFLSYLTAEPIQIELCLSKSEPSNQAYHFKRHNVAEILQVMRQKCFLVRAFLMLEECGFIQKSHKLSITNIDVAINKWQLSKCILEKRQKISHFD